MRRKYWFLGAIGGIALYPTFLFTRHEVGYTVRKRKLLRKNSIFFFLTYIYAHLLNEAALGLGHKHEGNIDALARLNYAIAIIHNFGWDKSKEVRDKMGRIHAQCETKYPKIKIDCDWKKRHISLHLRY